MHKIIVAATALAFLTSAASLPTVAFAQDKAGAGDTMGKDDQKMSKHSSKKSKKSSMSKSGDDMKGGEMKK